MRKALIYINGLLVHTVIGTKTETADDLRKGINVVIVVDPGDTPKCPKCNTTDNVVCALTNYVCRLCGSCFIPSGL